MSEHQAIMMQANFVTIEQWATRWLRYVQRHGYPCVVASLHRSWEEWLENVKLLPDDVPTPWLAKEAARAISGVPDFPVITWEWECIWNGDWENEPEQILDQWALWLDKHYGLVKLGL